MTDSASILRAIQQDARYLASLDYGTPRTGHPEGTVSAHIDELERNLRRLADKLSTAEQDQLRLVIHTHDTFKAEATRGVAINHPCSHASLACRFLSEFCDDANLLSIVQWHDEPYALWQKHSRLQTVDAQRLEALVERVGDWDLFLAFQIIDNCTAGKDREPLRWFLQIVEQRVRTRFSIRDLL